MSAERDALQHLITPLTNQGLDEFRMGRASNDELTRRVVDSLIAADYRSLPVQAAALWSEAEHCWTGSGCTHDDDSGCADSFWLLAKRLKSNASSTTPPTAADESGAGA